MVSPSSKTVWTEGVPSIHTERLVLRVPEPDEAPAIAEFYKRNLPHFMPWYPDGLLGRAEQVFWRESSEDRKQKMRGDEGYGWHIFLRDEPRTVIGFVSLAPITRHDMEFALIGYGLGEGWQGRGYMLEAVRATVRFAFEDLDLHRIEGLFQPENEKSWKVLEACGFQKEGLLRGSMRIGGEWRDHVISALLNENWKGTGRKEPVR